MIEMDEDVCECPKCKGLRREVMKLTIELQEMSQSRKFLSDELDEAKTLIGHLIVDNVKRGRNMFIFPKKRKANPETVSKEK